MDKLYECYQNFMKVNFILKLNYIIISITLIILFIPLSFLILISYLLEKLSYIYEKEKDWKIIFLILCISFFTYIYIFL